MEQYIYEKKLNLNGNEIICYTIDAFFFHEEIRPIIYLPLENCTGLINFIKQINLPKESTNNNKFIINKYGDYPKDNKKISIYATPEQKFGIDKILKKFCEKKNINPDNIIFGPNKFKDISGEDLYKLNVTLELQFNEKDKPLLLDNKCNSVCLYFRHIHVYLVNGKYYAKLVIKTIRYLPTNLFNKYIVNRIHPGDNHFLVACGIHQIKDYYKPFISKIKNSTANRDIKISV
ncbi:MAG: hypothetical protein Satyrvirus35_7 [Satyrvirus sp.]|uniref:Uncharacterized protein n=1 Tax=Satyrvirus sp. TaxID=2487771 RepID=A0A3G5AHG4_9VIRU|nr:MAG: hypothetical protein Satyrvirus35_7 [Satyrvirus sp.]